MALTVGGECDCSTVDDKSCVIASFSSVIRGRVVGSSAITRVRLDEKDGMRRRHARAVRILTPLSR